MDRGIKYWLRWLGVLPIALLAGFIADFPLHWVLYRTLSGGENPFITPYPELPERLLSPFIKALVIVWVSSQIAPENKFKTAIVLTTIWIFAAGASFGLSYFGINIGRVQLRLIAGGLPIIMGVVGAILGLYIVRKQTIKTT